MAVITGFEWRKTSDDLPPVRIFNAGKNKKGEDIIMRYNDRCLIIFRGKILISRYITEVPKGTKPRWEGLTANQSPDYWIFLRDIPITDTDQK